MKKADYLKKFHDKCPYCERPFKKSKYTVDRELVERWVESWLNSQ